MTPFGVCSFPFLFVSFFYLYILFYKGIGHWHRFHLISIYDARPRQRGTFSRSPVCCEECITKGFVIFSSRKKQFVQQREIPKKAMSPKRADRSFLFSSKTQERNSFTALFPICRKDSQTAMSDSPHGPRSSEHAGRKFHLSWRG